LGFADLEKKSLQLYHKQADHLYGAMAYANQPD
jgi:hypothetical protein